MNRSECSEMVLRVLAQMKKTEDYQLMSSEVYDDGRMVLFVHCGDEIILNKKEENPIFQLLKASKSFSFSKIQDDMLGLTMTFEISKV